jgi:hypothetical protein
MSKLSIIGILWTNTNAFATVSGLIGINGKGGHQHVKFFSTIDLGIGGLPQGWVLWTAGGMQIPCPLQGNPAWNPTGEIHPFILVCCV